MAKQKTHSIQGSLKDSKKQPLSGLLVQAFDDDPNTYSELKKSVNSDEQHEIKIFSTK